MTDKEPKDNQPNSVAEREFDIAKLILENYKKRSFGAALRLLAKLENRSTDVKIQHNKALLEYCRSDLKKTGHFSTALTNICLQHRLNVNLLDDVDHCVLFFNQAIILYHQRQYSGAIDIMEKVFKFVEAMEDSLAYKVSLLTVELRLCIRQPDSALNLITYLENQLVQNGQPPSEKIESSIVETTSNPVQRLTADAQQFLRFLQKLKIRCLLMLHQIESATTEIQALAKDDSCRFHTIITLANAEYLKGNFDASIALLDALQNDYFKYNEYGESSAVMYYNNMGVIHHAMGKYHLACHFYQTALKTDDEVAHFNPKQIDERHLHTLGGSKYYEIIYNLGVSLLFAGRPSCAFDCLLIAVRRYHRNARLWMRLAECCIMENKQSNNEEFDIHHKNKQLIMNSFMYSTRSGKRQTTVVLTSNLSHDKHVDGDVNQSYAMPTPSIEFASICLRNALQLIQCETQATPILPQFLIPAMDAASGNRPPLVAAGNAPSTPLLSSTDQNIAHVKNAMLAAAAYVCICLGDYVMALKHATELLSQKLCSQVHRLLGHLYSAEALVLLDRISEALEHLDPTLIDGIRQNGSDDILCLDIAYTYEVDRIPVQTKPPAKWVPETISSAISVMHYNMAVAKTIRGQLKDAMVIVKQIWHSSTKAKVPVHIAMLVVYIELQLGRSESAKNFIKQFFLHRKSV